MAEETTGFMAISPPPPTGPLAITKLVRGPDGTMQTVYIDARTGAQLNGLGGYTISNSQNYLDPNTLTKPTSVEDEKKPETVAEETIDKTRDLTGSSSDRDGGLSSSSQNSRGFASTNNFGYIDKPTGMGLIGMMPGPLGMAGKAINAAINANNVGAVDTARGSLGLPDQGLFDKAKGVVKDNKGQVADVSIGKNNYSVGFEALSPTGRTNLTPAEAQKRAAANQQTIVETPEDVVAAETQSFQDTYGKQNSGVLGSVKGFLDNLFGGPITSPFAGVKSPMANIKSPFARTSQFPAAPAAPTGVSRTGDAMDKGYDGSSYSGQNAGQDSPREGNAAGLGSGGGFGGLSRGGETGASTAEANRGGGGVSSGGTGLW